MVRKTRPRQLKVGTLYWEGHGVPKRYVLHKVTTRKGGVSILSDALTKTEARAFVQGWNKAKGRRGKRISVPGRRRR